MKRARTYHVNTRGQHILQGGNTLVEVLVSMLLGLVVIGGAAALYLSHNQTYAMVEGMSRLAENERMAVELLAREIREAGSTPCTGLQVPSAPGGNFVPNTATSNTWAQWRDGLMGDVFGKGSPSISAPSGDTGQVAGSSSLLIWNISSADKPIKISYHDLGNSRFTTLTSPGYQSGDVVVACDGLQIVTVELNAKSSGTTVPYTSGVGMKSIKAGGFLSPLETHVWYIGKTKVGAYTTALRRLTIDKDGSTSANDEMIRDVTDMQISYLEGNDANLLNVVPSTTEYVDAGRVVNWAKVIAVRVRLSLSTADAVGNVGTSNAKIVRPITFTVSLRGRLGAGA